MPASGPWPNSRRAAIWFVFPVLAAEPSFIGSERCASCHRGIHARQNVSHHAQSLRPPGEIDAFQTGAGAGGLALERRLDGGVNLVSAGQVLRLEWAFGSGAKGITPVGRTGSGEFHESRLSWYRSSGSFALTPGATRFEPRTPADRLGRPLTDKEVKECFGCHTSGYQPGQSAPARHEMGVRCESCHGPGAAHAAAMTGAAEPVDRKIVHPGKLDAPSQIRLCGQCHGRVPADTDLAAIRAIEANPNTARFPSTRLVLSRCYNEAAEGLKCSQCHDPHGNIADERSRFDAACASCHKCPKAQKDCSSCHMPKEQVMVQSEFTDHWIRVVRSRRP